MRQNKILILIACGILLLSLSACKKVYVQDGDQELVLHTNLTAESNSLPELLKRAQNVANVYYEMVITDAKGNASDKKVWLSGQKMKIESNDLVTILDRENNLIYTYKPSENKATKMNLAIGQQREESIVDLSGDLNNYKLQNVGQETIGNKNCLIYLHQSGKSDSQKVWLWQVYGLPIKIEDTGAFGKITTVFQNFDFTPIPDVVFNLPGNIAVNNLAASASDSSSNLHTIK